MQNAEKLSDGLHEASACLDGDSQTDGAATLLGQAERALARLARIDDQLAPASGDGGRPHVPRARLRRAGRRAGRRAELPARQSWTTSSSGSTSCTGCTASTALTCEEMLAYLEKAKNELDEIEFSSDRVEQLKKSCAPPSRRRRRLRSCCASAVSGRANSSARAFARAGRAGHEKGRILLRVHRDGADAAGRGCRRVLYDGERRRGACRSARSPPAASWRASCWRSRTCWPSATACPR